MLTGGSMLYTAYETRQRLLAPVYRLAGVQASALRLLPQTVATLPSVRVSRAVVETISTLELTHRHPGFGIHSVEIAGEQVSVEEDVISRTPFGSLVRFSKAAGAAQPRVLVIPGLAGHFGSLIRETVRTLLPEHEVYVADWHNARDVPVRAGRFGLDEYIEHLITFLEEIGPGTHLMAVCQPCVPALAAAAIMAEDDNPAQPQSVILLAGPVDARINPGPVNRAANRGSLKSLARTVITTVPRPHAGAGRRVYPGFMQAAGFLGMAPRRHLSAFTGLFRDLAGGNEAAAKRTTAFYDEYFSVLDVTEEFYLETARVIFREHDLARGCMRWRGRPVDPGAIRTALMTIEAENDEMCPPGQTHAAHDLCGGIPATRKKHHLQAGVGHYGVFSGTRFQTEIYPEIMGFIATADALTR
jgi:poly(3-hydroxybutyrate) depolymerase